MSLGGLHTVSFYDPATGTTVQLNSLLEKEGDLIIGRPFDENKNTRGEAVYAGAENTIELMVNGDSALFAQLLDWEKAGTNVRAVGAGYNRNLQWYESTKLQILAKNHLAPGNLNGRIVRLHRHGPELQIFANRNLLAYLGWQDASADQYPDAYTVSGLTSPNFSANVFTATYDADGDLVRPEIIFPITGITLTASYNVNAVSSNGRIQLRHLTFADALLGDQTTDFTTVGIKSRSLLLLSTAYKIQPIFRRTGGAAPTVNGISFPALTSDGSLTSATSFMDF